MKHTREIHIPDWNDPVGKSIELWVTNSRASDLGAVAVHALLKDLQIFQQSNSYMYAIGTMVGVTRSRDDHYMSWRLGGIEAEVHLANSDNLRSGHGKLMYEKQDRANPLIKNLDRLLFKR